MMPRSGAVHETPLAAWIAARSADAPAALRARVECYAASAPEDGPLAPTLAAAARQALDTVIRHPGDRSAALDLLAADALITLALLAQAEQAPAELGRFAAALLPTARSAA